MQLAVGWGFVNVPVPSLFDPFHAASFGATRFSRLCSEFKKSSETTKCQMTDNGVGFRGQWVLLRAPGVMQSMWVILLPARAPPLYRSTTVRNHV